MNESAATQAAVSHLPSKAARMAAIEILLADPAALGDDVLESALYIPESGSSMRGSSCGTTQVPARHRDATRPVTGATLLPDAPASSGAGPGGGAATRAFRLGPGACT